MDSGVRYHLLSVDAHLFIQVLVKLLIDVLNNWHPATIWTRKQHHMIHRLIMCIKGVPFIIVDLVTKARGVSHCQLQSDSLLLDHCGKFLLTLSLTLSLSLSLSHSLFLPPSPSLPPFSAISPSPWLTELTSVVLGMGCGPGVQAVRLIFDLNRVLTSVDLPKPLSPEWTV